MQFPVCHHGGWQECGLQSQALCALNITGDALQMAALVDCHFSKGAATGATAKDLPTAGSACSANVGIDYAKLFACAFEGQYPVPYGKGLLLAAFEKQIGRGVNSVPRMYLDGTETETWQDPKALLSAICAAYEKKNPGVSLPKGCNTSVHATDRPWLYSTKRCTVL